MDSFIPCQEYIVINRIMEKLATEFLMKKAISQSEMRIHLPLVDKI